MILAKTRAQIETETIDQLRAGGRITNIAVGGQARNIVDIVGDKVFELYQSIEANFSQSYVDLATGKFLNLIAAQFGLARRAPFVASVSSEDEIVKFFTSDGSTLVTHIPTKVIPSGTQVKNSQGSVIFVTTEDVQLNDVQTSIFVAAASTSAGPEANIGANILVVHSLSTSLVSVTNVREISNGSDVETDAEFRFRIISAVLTAQAGNTTAIRNSGLLIPGVADVIIREFPSGVGTVELLLIPSGTKVPRTSLNLAELIVARVRSAGTRVQVREPSYVSVAVTVQLDFTNDASAADKENARQGVPAAVFDILDDIPLGGTLIINQLRARILDVSTKIKDLRITCLVIRNRIQFIRNFRLFDDELFIPDPNATEAVTVI